MTSGLRLISIPDGLNRQYDEALKSAEKVLMKQPEPVSDTRVMSTSGTRKMSQIVGASN